MSQTTVERHSSEIIGDLVGRIVSAVDPLRIVLFGSAARGEMKPESDIDVLVVMPDGTHRLKTVRYLYQQLFGFGHPVDMVVATPSVLERHKDNIGLIYRTVLAEGKEIYAA
jgi:predicted nucleotidyltransferase